jgi:uncharacterized protein (TIGR00730 family)
MNILVFCSSQNVAEKYKKDAAELGTLIAKAGHTLVWGGSEVGMMKTLADAAQAAGGRIVAITAELIASRARKNADELVVTKDLHERKKAMFERADAVVALAGGTGTLDEAVTALEQKRLYSYDRPVIFLDTDGFYTGLKMQLERMEADGFLANNSGVDFIVDGNIAKFATTPEEVMQLLA